MPKVINNHSQPLSLDSGEILAAAGTAGAAREVQDVSERDRRRYVDTNLIRVLSDATTEPSAGAADDASKTTEKREVKK